jgi:hypothetical protein
MDQANCRYDNMAVAEWESKEVRGATARCPLDRKSMLVGIKGDYDAAVRLSQGQNGLLTVGVEDSGRADRIRASVRCAAMAILRYWAGR